MFIAPFLVAASLNLIMAQRLARRICEHCKSEVTPAHALIESVGMADHTDVQYMSGTSCDHCSGTGYRGRVALYELMVIHDRTREAIMEGLNATQLKQLAIEQGMITLRKAGIDKIVEGTTTVEEVLKVSMSDES